AAHHQPKQIFEFGTFDGRTTLNLHRNCPAAMIHTLDLPPTQQNLPDHKSAGELLQKHDTLGRVHQLYGNSLDFDFSDFVGKQDFVFIDAGHSYRNAISDSKNALRMLEGREGVIVWHDYG